MRRAVVILTLIFLAQNADAQTGYKIAHKPRRVLLLTGAGLIGLGFALSVLSTALESFAGQTPWMLVPLAGPWIAVGLNSGSNPCNLQTNDCSSKALFDVGLVGIGLTEAVGATLLAIGLVPQDQKTTVVTPSFGWRDGPRVGVTLRF